MAKDDSSVRLEQLREVAQPAADASVIHATSPDEELACALCYRPFPASELTVASKERFNFEAAVVVCPDCLGQLQAEMKEKTANADLVLGTIWGVLGWLAVTIPIALAIWFNYQWPQRELWVWLGCFIAFLPGFVIGRAVYYGTGRKHSWKQQAIAVGLTLLSALTLCYIGQNAAINLQLDIMLKNGHALQVIDPISFFLNYFIDGIINFQLTQLGLAGVILGLALGLTVAWFASAGPRIYTRPYLIAPPAPKPRRSKKNAAADTDDTED